MHAGTRALPGPFGAVTVSEIHARIALDLFRKSRGGLFQQGIEVVREERLRQMVPVSRLTALFVVRASSETAHRDSERLRI